MKEQKDEKTRGSKIAEYVALAVMAALWLGLGWWLIQLAILPDVRENYGAKAFGTYLFVAWLFMTVIGGWKWLNSLDEERPDGDG